MNERDKRYNAPIERVFRSLRDPDGPKGQVLDALQTHLVDFLEPVARSTPDSLRPNINEGLETLTQKSIETIRQGGKRVKEQMEEAHAEGYAAAAAGASVPSWTPSYSGDPYKRAPFSGDVRTYVRASIEEGVSYFRQDLQYIRKYVSEDEYAKAAAQVLARGDEEVVEALKRRGIDLNDFDTDALLDDAAEVFQNTKTMGSPDIRGILKELEPEEIANRDPELWRRIKRNGTDAPARIMNEVARDLAAQSPAINAVSWTLSTRHGGLESSPDQCDVLAGADPHGLGAGMYKASATPTSPHPNCECRITARTLPPEKWGEVEEDPPQDYQLTEEAIRQQLRAVKERLNVQGRTLTDNYVSTVRDSVYDVLDAVHENPRGQ